MLAMKNKKSSQTNKYHLVPMRDLEAGKLLRELAKEDRRTMGDTAALLIRKEYAIRHPETSNNPITYSISDKNAHSNKLP